MNFLTAWIQKDKENKAPIIYPALNQVFGERHPVCANFHIRTKVRKVETTAVQNIFEQALFRTKQKRIWQYKDSQFPMQIWPTILFFAHKKSQWRKLRI